MAKAFGVLLIVGMVWIGLELYMEGPARAFGGAFATILGQPGTQGEEEMSTPRRAGAAVERAHRQDDERRERMLAE